MAPRLTAGERPSWSTPGGRAGADVMERVADSARASRVRALRKRKTTGTAPGKRVAKRAPRKGR